MKKEGRVVVVSSRERKRAGEDAHTHTLKAGFVQAMEFWKNYGILEKLWNFENEIPYMEKLWNLSKTAVPMEKLWNFGYGEKKSACFL